MLHTLMPSVVSARLEASWPFDDQELFEISGFYDAVGPFEAMEADVLRGILNDGGQIYSNLRVHSSYEGARTYKVPVQDYEVAYVIDILDDTTVQPRFLNPFPTTRIMYSGRSYENSIVILIFGDGFSAEQTGTWPNPAQGTVLYHAYDAMNAMIDAHPFGEFRDLFTVYVINAYSQNPAYGGYLNTVMAGGTFAPVGFVSHSRLLQLAHAVVPQRHQNMKHVISNATGANSTNAIGWAFTNWYYLNHQFIVNIAVTSLMTASNPPGGSSALWPNGTLWHGVFLHEFGHSFGILMDEHGNPNAHRDEQSANSTAVPDEDVKWMHWAGHRNVLETPTRFADGWAIPTVGLVGVGTSGCMMAAPWGNRYFCGVCTAELIRRMAHLSGETFIGRSPVTGRPPPNTPTVTMPSGATRILDSAFHGNTSLNTITIPDSVYAIGDFAFIGTTGLHTIHNHSTIPQQINETTFAGLDRTGIDVFIPAGTTQAYLDAGWYGFNLIEGAGSVISVSSWEELRNEVNAVPVGVPTTISILNSFAAPRHGTGNGVGIVIPSDRQITLVSSNVEEGEGNVRTLLQQNGWMHQHFIVNGNLTLGKNITLSGGPAMSGGVTVQGGGTLTMNDGSVINVGTSVQNGVFTMYGGLVSNSAEHGVDGIQVLPQGSFTMYDGTVTTVNA